MAQGNKVVLSSDVDLNTMEGQAILGHELSHVRAQSMGIGTGNGLLQDASLEHQADTEGMLAARGMSIGGESLGMSMGLGMAGMEGLSPIGAGLSATAAAPMQAYWNPFGNVEKENNEIKRLEELGPFGRTIDQSSLLVSLRRSRDARLEKEAAKENARLEKEAEEWRKSYEKWERAKKMNQTETPFDPWKDDFVSSPSQKVPELEYDDDDTMFVLEEEMMPTTVDGPAQIIHDPEEYDKFLASIGKKKKKG